jgi:hypothetical protein
MAPDQDMTFFAIAMAQNVAAKTLGDHLSAGRFFSLPSQWRHNMTIT